MDTAVDLDALWFVYVVAALLGLFSLYLLFTSVLVRMASRYVENQKEKRKVQFYAQIIDHITAEEPDTNALEESIRTDVDIDLFVELVGDLMTQLDGQELPKLQALMALPVIRKLYEKKLRSKLPQQQIDACLYLSKLSGLDADTLARLRELAASDNQLLAHSAASGLLSSPDVDVRFEAVKRMAGRPRISRLALLEILYRFHTQSSDQFEEESERLASLVVDASMPAHNIGVVIRAITDIGYVQLLMVLYDLLESGFRAEDDEILEALIYSMGQFQFGAAGDWMERSAVVHPNPRIRRSAAQAFQSFNDPRFIPALMRLAQDPELDVRIKAIFALVSMGPTVKVQLDELARQTEELNELIRRIQQEMEAA